MIFTAIGITAFLAITIRFAFKAHAMKGTIQHRKA
jgi:hypothetical protein